MAEADRARERLNVDASPSPPDTIAAPQAIPVALAPHCPFCQSADTEPLALFGSQLSTAQYYCYSCHTPFEYMRKG